MKIDKTTTLILTPPALALPPIAHFDRCQFAYYEYSVLIPPGLGKILAVNHQRQAISQTPNVDKSEHGSAWQCSAGRGRKRLVSSTAWRGQPSLTGNKRCVSRLHSPLTGYR